MTKRIAILGSTGSIGTQAMEVIRQNPDQFRLEVLTAQNNCDLLVKQAIEFQPNTVVIGNASCYERVAGPLKNYPVKVFAGEESIVQIVESGSVDLVLNALVGYAGLKPTLRALESGKDVALANKETLVVAGELVMATASACRAAVIPVDSEHSAIFQCLVGEDPASLEMIYLTASGGPFRGKDKEHLKTVSRDSALKHPNWKMGRKITIDSASLMNKGLEVIEAHWLFGLSTDQIRVVIHPQSVIHSIVQFRDGSMKAQMGLPDMRLPILYALGFPERVHSGFPRFSFTDYPQLTFEKPDRELFRNLSLAYEAIEKGGNMPCILNASNEIAVQAFLEERIGFLDMPVIIEKCMQDVAFISHPALEDYIATHEESIRKASAFVKQYQS